MFDVLKWLCAGLVGFLGVIILVYYVAKAGTMGHLKAKEQFEDQHKPQLGEDRNGSQRP